MGGILKYRKKSRRLIQNCLRSMKPKKTSANIVERWNKVKNYEAKLATTLELKNNLEKCKVLKAAETRLKCQELVFSKRENYYLKNKRKR